MTSRIALFSFAYTVAVAGFAGAQQTQQEPAASDSVPKAYRPPPGMCRIWLDKVPPKQQPAPTDCPTAVKNKPSNGKVLFGDDYKEKGRDDKKELPFLKKFGADKTNP